MILLGGHLLNYSRLRQRGRVEFRPWLRLPDNPPRRAADRRGPRLHVIFKGHPGRTRNLYGDLRSTELGFRYLPVACGKARRRESNRRMGRLGSGTGVVDRIDSSE